MLPLAVEVTVLVDPLPVTTIVDAEQVDAGAVTVCVETELLPLMVDVTVLTEIELLPLTVEVTV